MSNHMISDTLPSWVTPDVARQMADQVVMACAEAGWPGVKAHLSPIRNMPVNYYFVGAPRDVIIKAGALVRQVWLRSQGEQSDERDGVTP